MHYLEGNKKIKVFEMKNQNCHNAIIALILKTVAIPFSDKNCRVKAVNNSIESLKRVATTLLNSSIFEVRVSYWMIREM